jgi:hypothetical protein
MESRTTRLFLLALLAACSRGPKPNPYGLDCVLPEGASESTCAQVAEHQQVHKLALTGARESVLTALSATRTATHLVVDATFQGAFRNAADQNLYLLQPGPQGVDPRRAGGIPEDRYAPPGAATGAARLRASPNVRGNVVSKPLPEARREVVAHPLDEHELGAGDAMTSSRVRAGGPPNTAFIVAGCT